jgi:hypothetical protein
MSPKIKQEVFKYFFVVMGKYNLYLNIYLYFFSKNRSNKTMSKDSLRIIDKLFNKDFF